MIATSLCHSSRRFTYPPYRQVLARTVLPGLCAIYFATVGGCEEQAEATRATPTASTTAVAIVTESVAVEASPIRLEPSALDFGPIQQGSTAEAIVRLINTSDKVLQIKQVKTTCGCTTAEVSKEPFGPGESIQVEVRLKTRIKPGSRANKIVRFVLEGDYDPVPLEVTAEIVQFVTIEPEQLERPITEDQKIVIRSVDRKPFRILEIHPPIVSTILAPQAMFSHELIVSADLWSKQGWPNALTLDLDHPDTADVELRIVRPRNSKTKTSRTRPARIAEPIVEAASVKRKVSRPVLQTHPRRLNFGHLTPTRDVEREIRLRDVTVIEGVEPTVRSDSPLVNVELLQWQASADGLKLNVRLTPVPGNQGRVGALLVVDYGSGRGFIEIHGRVRLDQDVVASERPRSSNETNRSQKKGE